MTLFLEKKNEFYRLEQTIFIGRLTSVGSENLRKDFFLVNDSSKTLFELEINKYSESSIVALEYVL